LQPSFLSREVCVQRRCYGLPLRTGAPGLGTAQPPRAPSSSQFLPLLRWGSDSPNPRWGCVCDAVVGSGSAVMQSGARAACELRCVPALPLPLQDPCWWSKTRVANRPREEGCPERLQPRCSQPSLGPDPGAGFTADQTDLISFTSAGSLPPGTTGRKTIPPEQRDAGSQPRTPLLAADAALASVSQSFL